MVKISVLVPVYNCENYIEQSIKSILNQTFKDIEVICVEDGSSDNSLTILNQLALTDKRLKVYSQENQGASIARNNALKLATGDYVYFFDADDRIEDDGLEKIYLNAINNDSDIAIFRFDLYQDNELLRKDRNFDLENYFGDVDYNNFSFTWRDIKDYILKVNSFAPWFKLYKKDFLDKYDFFEFPPHLKHNDVPFHIKTLLMASKMSFIPDVLYHYTFDNPNSITNNPNKRGLDIFHIVNIVEEFLKKKGFFDEFSDDFYFFKVKLLTRHMDVNTQEYFDLAKKEFSNIDLDNNELIVNTLLFRVESVLNSNDTNEYFLKQEIYNLERANKKLTKQNNNLKKKNNSLQKKNKSLEKKNQSLDKKNKDLNEKNKKLKEDLKKSKLKYKEVLNSTSWKITEPLRKPKQLMHHEK